MITSRKILLIVCLNFIFTISCYAQFEELVSKYDILSTIAGKGDEDSKGVNGWKAEYEGGRAIDAELSRPHFAMADLAGNIYIADKDAHAVRKISPNGIITTVAGTSVAGYDGDGIGAEHQLNAPNGLWVKHDGTLYILDLNNGKIRKLNPNGNLETIIDDPDGIAIGRGLWVSNDEQLIFYASGSRVKKWTPTEGISEYASGFLQLGNIIPDPSGKLVVTDRSANLVYRIHDDGSKQIIAGNGTQSGGGDGFDALQTGLAGVRAVWFLDDHSYFLATHEGSQVWYVDTAGIIHLFLDGSEGDSNHSGDGEHFQTPGYKVSEVRSISVDFEGNIIITENDRGFIRKIRRKNNTSVLDHMQKPQHVTFHVYPNPFNASTKMMYNLTTSSHVIITVYDVRGRIISSLVNAFQSEGNHEIIWHINQSDLSSGVYFYRVRAHGINECGKVIYLK